MPEFPISIVPAKPKERTLTPNVDASKDSKPETSPPDMESSARPEEPQVIFPIYEILKPSDEAPIKQPTASSLGNETFLSRSSRNVGRPEFYGKRFNIDVLDQLETTPA